MVARMQLRSGIHQRDELPLIDLLEYVRDALATIEALVIVVAQSRTLGAGIDRLSQRGTSPSGACYIRSLSVSRRYLEVISHSLGAPRGPASKSVIERADFRISKQPRNLTYAQGFVVKILHRQFPT